MNWLALPPVTAWAHSLSRYDNMTCNPNVTDLGIADPFLTGGVYEGIMDEAVSRILISSRATEHIKQTNLSRPP